MNTATKYVIEPGTLRVLSESVVGNQVRIAFSASANEYADSALVQWAGLEPDTASVDRSNPEVVTIHGVQLV